MLRFAGSPVLRSALLALVAAELLSCRPGGSPPVEHPGEYLPDLDARAVRVDRVSLTTEIDPVTFGPVGPVATTFPPDLPRIFLCFRLRGADEGALLVVSWYRVGEPDPLSTTELPVEGDSWLAAEHAPERRFRAGRHLARVELDGRTLAQVEFAIEAPAGSGSPAARVARLRLAAALDPAGSPRGRPVTVLPEEAREVHCAFAAEAPDEGATFEVRWARSGRVVGVTKLGRVEGRRELTASLQSDRALPAGEYRVEVLADGAPLRQASFRIGPRVPPGAIGSVSDLALTTAVDPSTRRPTAPPNTSLRGDEAVLFLSLRYARLPAGGRLEVRWYQDSHPDRPMAVTAFEVSGSGGLAASFEPDGPLPPGDYHVDAVQGETVLGTLAFSVGR